MEIDAKEGELCVFFNFGRGIYLNWGKNKEPMSKPYDAIVVGGGPAGVMAAYTLAKYGHSVVLLDKKSHDQIGNKTCGDALDRSSVLMLQQALDLDLPNGNEVSDVLNTMTIATEKGKISLEAPGYTVDRHAFGQRLLKEAERLGAKVIDSAPVRGVIIEDGFVKGVKYKKGNEDHEVLGKVVIDCSGTWAAVRRNLPEGFSEGLKRELPDHHIAASYREIIKLKRDHEFPQEIYLYYDRDIPSPGYIWYFTKGSNRLNVGTGWLKSDNQFIKGSMKQIFKGALHKVYDPDEYEVEVTGGGQIPIRPPFDCLTFNGGMVVGDAGCLVDPTTAEGHGPALMGGYYAGLTVHEAIERGDVSREGLWDYNSLVMGHFGARHAMSYVVLKYLRKIGPKGIEKIIEREFLTEDELTAIFMGKEVTFGVGSILKKLIKIFPHWGLPLVLRKMVNEVIAMRDHYMEYPADPANLSEWRKKRDLILGEEL